MRRRRFLATTAGLAGPLFAGCTAGAGRTDAPRIARTSEVSMINTQFSPRNVHVPVGRTVTWTNEDRTAHTVTSGSDNWTFDAVLEADEAAEHAFESSGVYEVYSRFDGGPDLTGMSMKVGVGDAEILAPLGGEPVQPSTAPM